MTDEYMRMKYGQKNEPVEMTRAEFLAACAVVGLSEDDASIHIRAHVELNAEVRIGGRLIKIVEVLT